MLLISTVEGMSLASIRKRNGFYSLPIPPIGLFYIARSIEDEGYEVEIIETALEENPEEKIIKSLSSCEIVGINVYTSERNKVASFAKLIKKHDSEMPIIIGGPHCTFYPDEALIEIPNADILVEGEGEFVIKDVLKALKGKKNLSDISGIYFRKNGIIKKGNPPQIIKELDSISFPSHHLADSYEYGKINGFYFFKQKLAPFLSSRGCPHNCRFCTRHVSSMKSFRVRSVENILDELNEINEKFNSVIILDDNFLADKKRAHKIMDSIIKNDLDLALYIAGTRVDTAEKELYSKMKKAGVKYISYGIESGNQRVLDYYRKKITLDQARKAVTLANQMGFITLANFLIGAPIETKKHIMDTINFAKSLPLDFAVFYMLCFMPGSDLWNEAIKEGKIEKKPGVYGYWSTSENDLSIFSEKELFYYRKKAINSFYLRPSYVVKEFIWTLKRKDVAVLKLLLSQLS